jgi:hypothetical protein
MARHLLLKHVASLALQIARYTMPFVVISAIFWLLHTWILDPVPNKFRRREFIRYRREILHVGTKLNFRSPARQVRAGCCWWLGCRKDRVAALWHPKRCCSEGLPHLK